MVSVGTSLIPFLEHNDANRALMGSNMQRQAVPLMLKQRPIVATGLECEVVYNNEYNIVSVSNAIVKYISKKRIIVHERIATRSRIENNKLLSQSFLVKKRKKLNILKYTKFARRTYNLKKSRSTNQGTNLYEECIVKKDEWVKKGQIITDGASSQGGKLSLGKNILVAYMPWKGYNFEDAIVISEQIVKNDTFTSIHIKKYKTFLISNETGEVR